MDSSAHLTPFAPRVFVWSVAFVREQLMNAGRRDIKMLDDDGSVVPVRAGMRVLWLWFVLWVGAMPLAALAYWTWDAAHSEARAWLAALVWLGCAYVATTALPVAGLLIAAWTAPLLSRALGVKWSSRITTTNGT